MERDGCAVTFLIRASQGRSREIAVSSGPAWSTEQVPSQGDSAFKNKHKQWVYICVLHPRLAQQCCLCRRGLGKDGLDSSFGLNASAVKQQAAVRCSWSEGSLSSGLGTEASLLRFPSASLALSSIQKYPCPGLKATGSRLASQSAWLVYSRTWSNFPGFSQKEPV